MAATTSTAAPVSTAAEYAVHVRLPAGGGELLAERAEPGDRVGGDERDRRPRAVGHRAGQAGQRAGARPAR